MWTVRFFCISFLCLSALQIGARGDREDPDVHMSQYVAECLAENGLNIAILGITDIGQLNERSFENLKTVVEEKRNCFVACLYLKQGLITSEGKLLERLPLADPKKKFPTSFADSVNACRGEKDFCRLGGCLYEVYY